MDPVFTMLYMLNALYKKKKKLIELQGSYCNYPPFTDEKTETQRQEVPSPSRTSGSTAHPFN